MMIDEARRLVLPHLNGTLKAGDPPQRAHSPQPPFEEDAENDGRV